MVSLSPGVKVYLKRFDVARHCFGKRYPLRAKYVILPSRVYLAHISCNPYIYVSTSRTYNPYMTRHAHFSHTSIQLQINTSQVNSLSSFVHDFSEIPKLYVSNLQINICWSRKYKGQNRVIDSKVDDPKKELFVASHRIFDD